MSDTKPEQPEEVIELSPEHQKFADEYLRTGNTTQSYLDAGYEVSRSVAAVCGYRLLRKAKVSAYVRREQQKLAEHAEIGRQDLIDYWEEVLATPVGIIDEDHHLAQEITHRFDHAGKVTSTTFKIPSKADAAKEIARLTGSYEPEKLDHSSSDGSMTPHVIERRIVDPKEVTDG